MWRHLNNYIMKKFKRFECKNLKWINNNFFRRKESDEKLARTLRELRSSITGTAQQRRSAVENMKLLDELDYSKETLDVKAPKSYTPDQKSSTYKNVTPRYLEKKKEPPK